MNIERTDERFVHARIEDEGYHSDNSDQYDCKEYEEESGVASLFALGNSILVLVEVYLCRDLPCFRGLIRGLAVLALGQGRQVGNYSCISGLTGEKFRIDLRKIV